MAKGRGRQPQPPAVQIFTMRARFPTLRLVDRGRLVWRGEILPIEGGRPFTIEVNRRWHGHDWPGVRVVAPPLVNMPGLTVPPHSYPDGRLCLYHPDEYWWSGDQLLANTIVPWACEWCFYYEVWRETGRWAGPEYDHREPKRDPRPRTVPAELLARAAATGPRDA